MQCLHGPARAAFAGLPSGFQRIGMGRRDDADQRLPVLAFAHHHRLIRMSGGLVSQRLKQRRIDQRHIARQHQQVVVTGFGQRGADAGQRSGEVTVKVLNQLIGVRRVLLQIAVARHDQVVGQRPGQSMQMLDQRLALPFDQPLVASAHALPLATGQQQDRTRGQGTTGIHRRLIRQHKGGL